MIILLSIFGIITGFIAGFFGLGGGMVLIPMLLFVGFSMKNAIAISIVQMVFTSTYGTFLNFKENRSLLKDGLFLGSGGFIGGILSGTIINYIDGIYLQYLFILIVMLAILKIYLADASTQTNISASHNKSKLIFIGFSIGLIAMSIGVGGSIMLTPVLISYMYYNLKDASSMGLFFVVFSSIAGFISLSYYGNILYFEGITVGLLSTLGVYFGIKIRNKVNILAYKKLILLLYIVIFISVISNIILG